MTTSAPTIIDLKISFLRSQILLLSQPFHPSTKFLTSVSEEENALRQKNIDEALYKLNRLLKQHNKLSYGPQALRHVAEQVDRLYWNAGKRDVVGACEQWAEKTIDLREDHIIEQLPEEWNEEVESEAAEQTQRYKELQSKLVELNEKRRVAREKLKQYKAAKQLLNPFQGEEAGLQDNLVTKNGEMERELERMRMLMLRVERGLQGLEENKNNEEYEMDIDIAEDTQKKLLALLEG